MLPPVEAAVPDADSLAGCALELLMKSNELADVCDVGLAISEPAVELTAVS